MYPPSAVKSFTLALSVAALLAAGACTSARQEAPSAAQHAVPRDAAQVAKGARLAAIGNCRGCHTARDGAPLAGGVPLHSPLGTIWTTNITPDVETGIGAWSEADFRRAMREGVAPGGRHLYPAFPYDRFTHATDEDIAALYAWVMAQAPVRHVPPETRLAFPFNLRAGLAVWNRLFLHEGPKPLRTKHARGEYLVESLGHCGSCHSPRNALQAERRDRPYAGGDSEGWHAYALDASNRAPRPWEPAQMAAYLRHGFDPAHGIARGTMGLVTAELAHADPADVAAMAAYVVSLMQEGEDDRGHWPLPVEREPLAPRGRLAAGEGGAIYRAACLECHDGSRPLPFGGLPLAWSIGVSGESPRNLVNVILHGLDPAGDGATTPVMPGYAGSLTDAQVEALVAWLRANFTHEPPWENVGAVVRESRRMDTAMLRFPPGGSAVPPAAPGVGR